MKTLNNFLNTDPLWKVYISVYTFFVLFFYILLSSMFGVLLNLNPLNFGILKGSLVLSLVVSSLYTLAIFSIRKSEIFFKELKNIEKLVDEYDTEVELRKLYNDRLIPLYKKSLSMNQTSELNIVRSLLNLKYRTITKNNKI